MLPKDFWTLTFHEFLCTQKGINDRFELEQRQEWERIRWLACVNLQPHTKKGQNLTPQKLVRFDWEKKKVKTDAKKQRKRAEYINKKYKLLNKKDGTENS